jgi:hypothetical protein
MAALTPSEVRSTPHPNSLEVGSKLTIHLEKDCCSSGEALG